MKRTKLVKTIVAAVGFVTALCGVASALHRDTPPLFALTAIPGGNSSNPHVQGDQVSWVVFESTDDLMQNGSTGREVFIFNMAPPRSMGQVTNFDGDSMHPTVSVAGEVVAFDSNADILHNGSTGRQIFLWNRRYGTYSQVTRGVGGDSTYPYVNANANTVVFQSTADLNGSGSGGASNIFIWSPKPVCSLDGCHRLFQLTYGPGDSRNAKFSNDGPGNLVIFESRAPLLRAANGFYQIFLYDRTTPELHQLTNYPADSINATVTEDGRFVAFQSQADILGNGSSGWEVFVLDRTTGIVQQITNSGGDSINPSMGPQADYLLFVSNGDLLGTGSTGQHLFVYDFGTQLLYQLTKSPVGDSDHPKAGTGFVHFFDSTEDPMRTGITGRQVYAINLFNRLPSATIGDQAFRMLGGDGTTGSQARLTTAAGVVTAGVAPGEIGLEIGAPDLDGETTVNVPKGKFKVPPIPIPGFGALCMHATENGTGFLDCDGGHRDQNVTLIQDHNTDDSDPLCVLGCREGSACNNPLWGPHRVPCPRCVNLPCPDCVAAAPCPKCLPGTCPRCLSGVCSSGTNGGQACVGDGDCPASEACTTASCNSGLNAGAACTGDVDCPPSDVCTTSFGLCDSGTAEGGACAVDGDCPADGLCSNQSKICSSGVFAGQACTSDDTCLQGNQCIDGGDNLGVCNGNLNTHLAGVYDSGGMVLTVPIDFSVSVDMGLDRTFCTADDQYRVHDIPNILRLTTGIADGTILDADNVLGTNLVATETGGPFICSELREGRLGGASLAGNLTLYHIPDVPGFRDIVITFGFDADPRPPCLFNCQGLCLTNAECDDGNPCNGLEACASGQCRAGTPINCSDLNACNGLETCDPSTGLCVQGAPPVCNDGNPCNGEETCDLAVGCLPGNPILCSDGNFCNGVEFCNPATGGCQPAAPPQCLDTNPCNGVESCDPTLGCVPGTPIACSDGNACNGAEVCDPATALCGPGTPLVCDDGNPCNGVETCDNASGCLPGTPIACDDGDPCNGAESCDTTTGACLAGTLLDCNDGNLCNGTETCNPGVGCIPGTPVVCNDGDFCNGLEGCDPTTGGCIAGTPLVCDDGNPCSGVETCNPAFGCIPGAAIVCTDNDACNGAEVCDSTTGLCGPGTPLDCDDGLDCTVDSCQAVGGCKHEAMAGNDSITCLLDALRSAVLNASRDDIKTFRLRMRLVRLVEQARNRVLDAQTTTPQAAGQMYSKAVGRIGRFSRVVEKSHRQKTRISAPLTEQLLGIAQSAMAAMAPLTTTGR